MELSDISDTPCDKTAISYENIRITAATKKPSEQTETDEGHYEQLRLSGKPCENCDRQEQALSQMKCLVFAILAMLVVLYIITFVVIIIALVPRDQVDGTWAQWSPWSFCDVTCGNGTKTKYRTCTDPPPADGGLYCSGNAIEVVPCQMPSCTVDGLWAQWSPWSFCDVTCGNGTKARYRLCSDPPPTEGGIYCSGNATDVATCQMPPCTDIRVSFAAKKVTKGPLTALNQRIVFDDVLNNEMNGYDSATGIFRAPVSGVYLFIYFMEIGGTYGKVELRLEGNLINDAEASYAYGGSFEINIDFSGFNHKVTIGDANPDVMCQLFESSGRCSVSGFNKTTSIQPCYDSCQENDDAAASGGNSAITYVRAGEKVWIQAAAESATLDVRPGGTTFSGVLLFFD